MYEIPSRVMERVLANVAVEGDCLVSLYATGNHGYTWVSWSENCKSRGVLCHRASWIAVHGGIPDGLTIDHICRNRRCIKIDHLRLLTLAENGRRNGNIRKTHCPSGHPYSVDNTYIKATKHGSARMCKTCHAKRCAERYQRRKAGTT